MMISRKFRSSRFSGALIFPVYCFWLFILGVSSTAHGASVKDAGHREIGAFFRGTGKTVLTFVGYSGAGYEDEALLRKHAEAVLSEFSPAKTIVNIGATPEGIGAIYEMAKRKGFVTTGIVSSQAKEHNMALSTYVDHVFYVKDPTWGGFIAGTKKLSPTSKAMVENSQILVGIGGGEIARDELIEAKRLGKKGPFHSGGHESSKSS